MPSRKTTKAAAAAAAALPSIPKELIEPTTARNRFADPSIAPNAGTTNIAALEYNVGYAGTYGDKESGLFYKVQRSYSADRGTYTQVDPIRLAGGWNERTFAFNNPLMFNDPDGLRANRPKWWNDLWDPQVDTRYCASAECAAGLQPNRTPTVQTGLIGNLSMNVPMCGPLGMSISCKVGIEFNGLCQELDEPTLDAANYASGRLKLAKFIWTGRFLQTKSTSLAARCFIAAFVQLALAVCLAYGLVTTALRSAM